MTERHMLIAALAPASVTWLLTFGVIFYSGFANGMSAPVSPADVGLIFGLLIGGTIGAIGTALIVVSRNPRITGKSHSCVH